MEQSRNMAAAAAASVAVLSILSLAVGVLLMSMLGGTSGQDLGQGAPDAAFARAVPVLGLAEVLKMLTAAAQLVVVAATAASASGAAQRAAMGVTGAAGAILIAASGIVGLYAIATSDATAGKTISDLGFFGIAATGLWLLLVVLFKALPLPVWLTAIALAVAATSLGALLVPPLVMLSGVLGLVWWFGLAAQLRRSARRGG